MKAGSSTGFQFSNSHGKKSSYADKQKRMAGHIEEGYEKRGLSRREHATRAWET